MADLSGSLYTFPGAFVSQITKVSETALLYDAVPNSVHTYYRGVSGSVYTYSIDSPPANSTNIVVLGTKTS